MAVWAAFASLIIFIILSQLKFCVWKNELQLMSAFFCKQGKQKGRNQKLKPVVSIISISLTFHSIPKNENNDRLDGLSSWKFLA